MYYKRETNLKSTQNKIFFVSQFFVNQCSGETETSETTDYSSVDPS